MAFWLIQAWDVNVPQELISRSKEGILDPSEKINTDPSLESGTASDNPPGPLPDMTTKDIKLLPLQCQ